MVNPDCQKCGERSGWVGVWVNVTLGILKLVVGLASGSHACVADALASALNVFTAFSIFISRRFTSRPTDERFPYGYGKAEFLAAGIVAVIVVVLTIGMVVNSLRHIIYTPQPPPRLSACLVALVSITANEMLFRYFRCVGTELRSQTMMANAWANRGEAFGSVSVLIGVIGAQFGIDHLDPIASLIVSAIIFKFSIGIIRDSVTGLMDKSLPPATLEELQKIVLGVEGIRAVPQLRARQLGDKIWVELVVGIDRQRTVRQCEDLRCEIQRALREGLNGVEQVLVDFEGA